MTPQDLTPQNITVKHQSSFNTQGVIVPQTVVTFWLGTQGPFTKVYPGGQDTPEIIKADILKQRDAVASILNV